MAFDTTALQGGPCIDGDLPTGVGNQHLVARQQIGERVGYGVRTGEQGEAVAHRPVGRRGTTPADLDESHTLGEGGLEPLPHLQRRDILGQRKGDPLARGCHSHRESLGMGHLDVRIETLRVLHGKAAATQ